MSANRAPEAARRGVVDPRLLKHARATRPFIAISIALGCLSAALVIAQAWLLADVIAGAFAGGNVVRLTAPLLALLGVVLGRSGTAWGTELAATRSATLVKLQLRQALLRHLAVTAPGRMGERRTGELATLATRGLDALDSYFSLYLPQLVLAAIVPVAVVAAIVARDWISAAIIVFTVPLIPVFMALIGMATRERTEAQLRTLQRLASHFLDVLSGLATLKVFGRSRAQTAVIREISERQRRATVATLRITFLSALVLELVATLSVAVVAVAVGLRLLGGEMSFSSALFVLVLAPEAYLPLRSLGANYHASAEGERAAEQVFSVLETPSPPQGRRQDVPDPAWASISIEDLTVRYPGRASAALDHVSLRVEPGETVAVCGPSGAGKSTLLSVLLGFVTPTGGTVRIGDEELVDLDLAAWRQRISWLSQRPHLFATSIEENIRLGRPDATDSQVRDAALAAGLGGLLSNRQGGLGAKLGDRGDGISAGERQRVALARAFLRDAPLLLLDEPTANLDGATEEEVLRAIRRLVEHRTAIVVAHRSALMELADRVVTVGRVAVAV